MKKLTLFALLLVVLMVGLTNQAQAQEQYPFYYGVCESGNNACIYPGTTINNNPIPTRNHGVVSETSIAQNAWLIGLWTYDFVDWFWYGPWTRWYIRGNVGPNSCHDGISLDTDGFIKEYYDQRDDTYFYAKPPAYGEVWQDVQFVWFHGVGNTVETWEGELFAVNNGAYQYTYYGVNEDCIYADPDIRYWYEPYQF